MGVGFVIVAGVLAICTVIVLITVRSELKRESQEKDIKNKWEDIDGDV